MTEPNPLDRREFLRRALPGSIFGLAGMALGGSGFLAGASALEKKTPTLDEVLISGNRSTKDIELDGSKLRFLFSGNPIVEMQAVDASRMFIRGKVLGVPFQPLDPVFNLPGYRLIDDFDGNALSPIWATTITGTGNIIKISKASGYVELLTNGTLNSTARLHMNGISVGRRNDQLYIEFRLNIGPSSGNVAFAFGLVQIDFDPVANLASGNQGAIFKANGGQANFFAATRGAFYKETDTGMAIPVGVMQTFRIELDPIPAVRFYINDLLVYTEMTNLNMPSVSTNLQPYVGINNLTAANKDIDLDYISIIAGRS